MVFTLVALLAPWLVPYDPLRRVGRALASPSWAHPLGTDEVGRDLLSRIILGVRLTWLPGLGIIASGVAIGGALGVVAGVAGGWVDMVIERLTDLFLVIPASLIALAVVATLGAGTLHVMLALMIFWWPWYARIVRAETRAIAASLHVEAARVAGVGRLRLLWRFVLPGALPAILVTATLDVANVVLTIALLSFLGLGAPAPQPELGAMVARTLDRLTDRWWLPIAPALVLFLLALSANHAGDALRRALRHA
jgi:peptide/nickel transport system permease protein